MTAAFVLLCSVYCACGGVAPPRLGHSAGQPERQAPADCTTHCHNHGEAPAPSDHDGTPGSGQSGHTGCAHCHPVLSILESSGGPSTLHALIWSATVLLAPSPPVEVRANILALVVNQDLPPPASAPTLLSLHCALNM